VWEGRCGRLVVPPLFVCGEKQRQEREEAGSSPSATLRVGMEREERQEQKQQLAGVSGGCSPLIARKDAR